MCLECLRRSMLDAIAAHRCTKMGCPSCGRPLPPADFRCILSSEDFAEFETAALMEARGFSYVL